MDISLYIDMIQNTKRSFVDTVAKDVTVNTLLKRFIDLETQTAKTAVDTVTDTTKALLERFSK